MTTYTLKELWNLACKHDSIEPTSKFVIFSDTNPWAKKYNTLACLIIGANNGTRQQTVAR